MGRATYSLFLSHKGFIMSIIEKQILDQYNKIHKYLSPEDQQALRAYEALLEDKNKKKIENIETWNKFVNNLVSLGIIAFIIVGVAAIPRTIGWARYYYLEDQKTCPNYVSKEDIHNYCKDYIVSLEHLPWDRTNDGMEQVYIGKSSCKREPNSRLIICQLP